MCSITTLPNGIRVVSETVPWAHSVAVGIWIDTGARDETEANSGISHFIEHMLFKGTERRSAQQIAEELDAIGGQLNAFTDKEYTCYYCKVLPEHLEIVLEVIADMVQHSLMEPEELEREKQVILEEFKHLEDTPEDLVHDLFVATLWPRHPLGRPVIGRPEVIEGLTREAVCDFVRRRYVPGRTLVAAAGNLQHEQLVEAAGRLFGAMEGDGGGREEAAPEATAEVVTLSKPVEQVHFCLGTRGCSQLDEDRYALGILDTALGGGMSSRLFQEIREKRGLCYSIGTYTASYREGGLLAVYAGTSPENVEQVQDLSRRELAAVAREGLGPEELDRARNQIRASVLLSLDSVSGRMSRLAKSLLYYGRILDVEEIVTRIAAVTAADAQRVAAELFGSGEFACAAIGPFEE
jgi:predicted Zn-dependent peptidase